MNYIVFDIESNGLLYEQKDKLGNPKAVADKLWCLCAYISTGGWEEVVSFTDYNEMRSFIKSYMTTHVFVAHNGIRFDKPMLAKFLNVDLKDMFLIDTLALSWTLFPKRDEHGLESWGDTLGIAKPKIADWQAGSLDEYLIRCQEDVKINVKLFCDQIKPYLQLLYGNWDDAMRYVRYLMFKMDCAAEQEAEMWRLDKSLCEENLTKLKKMFVKKKRQLAEVMPPAIKWGYKERPKKCYLKDGITPSKLGMTWFELLKEHSLPEDYLGKVKIEIKRDVANPGSHAQVKNWLLSLGWVPDHIKQVKHKKTGVTKDVPQIASKEGDGVSESVKDLYKTEPNVKHLEGFYIIKHRKEILEGFLRNVNSQGYVQAQIKGFTNTLRFQHTTLVNLPTIPKPYWEMVRGCLIADINSELCGSDMSSLEDNTKHHYMMYFDPEAVKLQRTPGFDAHINMAVVAKYISWDEGEFYKWYDKRKDGKEYKYIPYVGDKMANSITGMSFDELCLLPDEAQTPIIKQVKPIRLKSKKVNFAAVYGAGIPKLAITANVPLSEAKDLHTAYWIINKAVKDVGESCITKEVAGQMWLFNPVSKFWYSLRELKDRFSTLNQGTGVYCFDTWIRFVRQKGVKLIGQFHDEIINRIPIGTREAHTEKLQTAIKETNQLINLNVELKISIDYGQTYAEIH